ncbi:MAG: hypothetical protein JO049_16965 [Hyphomicrobiales bacterium]|jgi:hypothetical protein|nr:hypothetical protein [Hyphomicrobiales bacterium]
MIEERDASEEEMVLEFLKAECGRPLIDDADLSNVEQNAERAKLLDARRGYARRLAIFQNFPRDVRWRRSKLTRADYAQLRYVNSSPWRPLAGPDLRVVDGASRINGNTFDRGIATIGPVVSKIQTIVRSIRAGRDPDAALILAETGDGRLVVLEGNHRVTAFVIADVSRPIASLIGSSSGMVAWANQGWL